MPRLLQRIIAPAAAVPRLQQSAAQRAKVDTSTWGSSAPIRFGLLTTVAVGGMAVLSVWLTSHLPLVWQIIIAMASAAIGFLVAVALIFVVMYVAAPSKQRDEARAALKPPVEAANRAYADASRVKADVSRRAGFAQRFLDDQLAVEDLESAAAPMTPWDDSKLLLADVLPSSTWRTLVSRVEAFNEQWERLSALAQSAPTPRTATEKGTYLADLLDASKRVISDASEIESALDPVLGDAAGHEKPPDGGPGR